MRKASYFGRARLTVWEAFASAEECRQLIELARPRLTRSTVVDQAGGSTVMDVRTSQGAAFAIDEYPMLTTITDRAARTLAVPRSCIEPLQIIRYGVGDRYEPHNDWFDPAAPSSTDFLKTGGQRIKTLLIYLNTPALGGETSFPEANASVSATEGNAVQFEYPTASQADNCLHGGSPVSVGEKWAVNVWARERDYGSPPPNDIANPWIFNSEDSAKLRAFYDANEGRAEGPVDHVVRVRPEDPLWHFVARVKDFADQAFPEPKVVETVVLARMPAGVSMQNHADNVQWTGTSYEPNHTPDRTHTAVVFLNDGDGATTFGDNPDGGTQTVIHQQEGHAHIHRCGPQFHHRVSASTAPRYTFVVWFKRP